MPVGKVKWFNTAKGYGFIETTESDKDVFVHVSQVEASGLTGLADEQTIEFELIDGPNGKQMAGNLKIA